MKKWLRDSRLSGVVLIALLLLAWQLSAMYVVNTPTWPTVTEILGAWYGNLADGTLFKHLLATLWRQMLGYGIAVVLGVGVGLAMGYFRPLYNLFEPLVEVLRPIPGPAYLPLLVLFVGIGHEMKVVLILVASFFPIVLNTYSGVRSIDRVQFDTARTLGLTTLQTFRELVLPAASPQILTGMRISLAIALIVTVIAEMVAGNNGIGFYILNAQRSFLVAEMYAGVIALALLGFGLNKGFVALERMALRWHEGWNAAAA